MWAGAASPVFFFFFFFSFGRVAERSAIARAQTQALGLSASAVTTL